MSLTAVATVFAVHPNTIKNWICRGILPGARINNRLYVAAPAVRALQENTRVAAKPVSSTNHTQEAR